MTCSITKKGDTKMRQAQAIKKVKSMKRDVARAIDVECNRLLRTGAIDLASYPDDYQLPKALLVVALENISHNYRPPQNMKHLHTDIVNLRRF
jgi:hypothetical protein